MPTKFDPKDRQQLEESLKLWKARLAKENTQLSLLRRQEEALRRQKQIAQSRIERRDKQIAALDSHPGRQQAVKIALGFVGVTEHPPSSNRGPMVDKFEAEFHIQGQPWCGCFVGYVAREAGAHPTDRIVYTPYIYEDACNHQNGLDHVVWHDTFKSGPAHSGDLVLYDFGGNAGIEHVGMLVKPWNGSGPLQTVEGNTSFGGGGSQDNGGAVARRSRDISLVHSIVALKW